MKGKNAIIGVKNLQELLGVNKNIWWTVTAKYR